MCKSLTTRWRSLLTMRQQLEGQTTRQLSVKHEKYKL